MLFTLRLFIDFHFDILIFVDLIAAMLHEFFPVTWCGILRLISPALISLILACHRISRNTLGAFFEILGYALLKQSFQLRTHARQHRIREKAMHQYFSPRRVIYRWESLAYYALYRSSFNIFAMLATWHAISKWWHTSHRKSSIFSCRQNERDLFPGHSRDFISMKASACCTKILGERLKMRRRAHENTAMQRGSAGYRPVGAWWSRTCLITKFTMLLIIFDCQQAQYAEARFHAIRQQVRAWIYLLHFNFGHIARPFPSMNICFDMDVILGGRMK